MNFSLQRFPLNATLQESSGLPWGCILQPFSALAEQNEAIDQMPQAHHIGRCINCFAYINNYVRFNKGGNWCCSICATWNKSDRYTSPISRGNLPELRTGIVECAVPLEEKKNLAKAPVYILLADVSGSAQTLELAQHGLTAALESLPADGYVGLITFSDRIGLFDLTSTEKPHVKYLTIPNDEFGCQIGLEEIFPLSNFFVEVGVFKQNIEMAIAILSQPSTWVSTLNEQNPSQIIEKRGFGATIAALVDYLNSFSSSTDEEKIKSRIICFLFGTPNHGVGNLQMKTGKQFYDNLAKEVVEAGTSIDIFGVGNSNQLGFESLYHFVTLTSGSLNYYNAEDPSILSRDVHRKLSMPHVFSGLLRLRTSTASFRVATPFGNLSSVPGHEHMYKINLCDSASCFAFGFEFIPSKSFEDYSSYSDIGLPTVQMAFAYYILIPIPGQNRSQFQKRLRLYTTQVNVASSVKDVFEGVDVSACLSILTHKVLRSSFQKGLIESRLLVQDWLTMLITHYTEKFISVDPKTAQPSNIDLEFTKSSKLKLLSRYVFGLLKHEILQPSTSPDRRACLNCLLSSLPPLQLVTLFYPNLLAYENFDRVKETNLRLTRQALVGNEPIFLVDALTKVIVYYGISGLDLPRPPKDSLLDTSITQLKTFRQLVPMVYFVKAGTQEASLFDQLLIEDENTMAPMGDFVSSFDSFMTNQAIEVAKELNMN